MYPLCVSILVSAHRLEKNFASRTLFSGLTFAVNDGDRIGFIGPNGAGKSTLMKIIAGTMERDGGDLSFNRGARVALLDQAPAFKPGITIHDELIAALEDPYDFEQLATVDEMLSKLQLNKGDITPETLIEDLSGGWKKRVALGRALVTKPDLLLLDEPTNHLDVHGIEWLENFIADAKFATITITHDRLFLQRVANRIFDLDPRYKDGLLVVNGEYLTYLETRDELMRSQERREIVLKNTLRRETEWLRRGAKARTTKQQARITRAGDLGEEVEDLSARNVKRRVQIDFQESERNPQRLVEAKKLTKSFTSPDGVRKVLFENLDLILTPKTRLGLLGPNGCGKSTLIRCLLGKEQPDSGEVRQSEKIEVGYFEQHRETLDPEKTLLKNIVDEGDYVMFRGQHIFARSYLDRFLFRTEQHDMPVKKLSGGEQARLRVAQMMLTPSNILVLDEPTNDLDMATMAVLEEVLADFKGAVILVSHDRYFLDQVSNRILAFDKIDGDPALVEFSSFEQWEEWRAENLRIEALKAAQEKAAAKAKGGSKKKLTYKDKLEFDGMEAKIHGIEAELSKIQTETTDPKNAANASRLAELYSEISKLQAELERLYARWAELEAMQ
jgi:ATP-binding cassette subfamily F protein uup